MVWGPHFRGSYESKDVTPGGLMTYHLGVHLSKSWTLKVGMFFFFLGGGSVQGLIDVCI